MVKSSKNLVKSSNNQLNIPYFSKIYKEFKVFLTKWKLKIYKQDKEMLKL